MDSSCEWLTPHFTIAIINTFSISVVSQSHTNIIDYSRFISQSIPLFNAIHSVWQRPFGDAHLGGPSPPASDGGRMPAKCPL